LVLVRTIIELVKNKSHYAAQYSSSIGLLNEVLRQTCKNGNYCELYELVALTNVLNCDVQSVYPYIDYRAEMKIMNALYKPLDTSTPVNGRLLIFWTSTQDELSTRNRPGNGGLWSPNHFVPLVQPYSPDQTVSNNQKSFLIKPI
jgi:hypothetical protein